jgi:RNA recognition motif-containing protein
MDSEAESNAAAEALNGFSIEGRQLRVNVAEERAARPKTF